MMYKASTDSQYETWVHDLLMGWEDTAGTRTSLQEMSYRSCGSQFKQLSPWSYHVLVSVSYITVKWLQCSFIEDSRLEDKTINDILAKSNL